MAKKPAATTTDTAPATINAVAFAAIVEATKAGNVFYVSADDGKALVDAGYIEVNFNMPDPHDANRFAARATDAGMTQFTDSDSADKAATTSRFIIEDDIPIAPRKLGGGNRKPRESIYPFDQLNPGQSFHVPATEKSKNPARTMATAASQAQRKHAVEDGFETNEDGSLKLKDGERIVKWKPTRTFTVRAVDESDPRGVGARVYRTA